MVGTPRCGVTGRVQRAEFELPLIIRRFGAPLNIHPPQ